MPRETEAMISMVVPTRNRAHTLRLVGPSYCKQKDVTEIIFVDDAGEDDTSSAISELQTAFPAIKLILIRNDCRKGPSASRNIGASLAHNEFILFCDDDEYLEDDYAVICREKLIKFGAGAVSGRRVYMREGETDLQALTRFSVGSRNKPPYDRLLCELIAGAKFEGDRIVPFTNAVILTRKTLVTKFGFDDFYSRGNCYREESDYQMNLFVNGMPNVITSDVHSVHLPPSKISVGAKKKQRLKALFWSVYYTNYFYGKYWSVYSKKVGIPVPRHLALAFFAIFAAYRQYLRPSLVWLVQQASGLQRTA